jgi:hypothetical protein
MDTSEERQPPDVITSDTDNATKVEPKDAPAGKRAKFKRFRAYNRGTWNGPKRENKDVIHRQDNLHRYDSISSSLGLKDHQRQRGRKVLDELDFRRLGCSVDKFIFGVCILVANYDVEDGNRYYPHPEATGDADFVRVAESLGLDQDDQISIVEKVRSRVDI